MDADLSKTFGQLDSGARPLENQDRLRIFHDFFRPGEEEFFQFDLSGTMRKGHDFRDYICPDGMQFKAGYFELDGKVGPRPVSAGICVLYQGRDGCQAVRLPPEPDVVH